MNPLDSMKVVALSPFYRYHTEMGFRFTIWELIANYFSVKNENFKIENDKNLHQHNMVPIF